VKDRVAIVGVGYSAVGRRSGLSYKELTLQSALAAMDDAGMGPRDIDGICLRAFGQPEPWGEPAESAMNDRMAAHMLGIVPTGWFSSTSSTFADLAASAMAAVGSGFCHTCLVVHPCKTQASRPAAGAARPAGPAAAIPGDYQFAMPFGAPGPGMVAGLTMQRHMALYGTTEDQIGLQQVTQRRHAGLNERALFRDPLTLDDYLASRWVSRPVRLLDCDYPCDTSGAVIFTTEERASHWRKPVFVEAAAMASIDNLAWEYLENILESALWPCARTLWSQTDLRPSDVDCAELYDGFSMIALSWMEALGFCGMGEAGPFIAEGHTALGGSLPVNTDGGVCNVGRHHGSSHCIEAVGQLRGECGERQVEGAEVAVYSVAHGPYGHAALLTAS
jgi:acetyl-CoA acetyltransferase